MGASADRRAGFHPTASAAMDHVDFSARAGCVLVADDSESIRALYVALLKEVGRVADVVAVPDGAAAVGAVRARPYDVAILDLHMPRLDGVAAAARIAALRPSIAIALNSSDPEALQQRASGLRLPLFDKADFDALLVWVVAELAKRDGLRFSPAAASLRDRSCSRCGYGIACASPPQRCPMCGRPAEWVWSPRGRDHATI
jgi:CheY-like chemotaxis protein